jgi:histidine triad (HIT) family protein
MRYTLQNNPTIFGKILRGEIPVNKQVYEDEYVLVFHDISPKAAVHLILIPKTHLKGLNDAQDGDEKLLGHMLVVANKVAQQLGVSESGFRLISNAGPDSGQEVPHLHFHLLAGEPLPGF